MKSLIKVLTFAVVTGWCGIAVQAQPVLQYLDYGWGFNQNYSPVAYYSTAGYGITQLPGGGNFDVTGSAVAGVSWLSGFNPVTLGIGETISANGYLTLNNGVGGGALRIVLGNITLGALTGPNAAGNYQYGSGSYAPGGGLGYMILSPSGGIANWNSGGNGPVGDAGTGNWVSTTGGYALPLGGSMTTNVWWPWYSSGAASGFPSQADATPDSVYFNITVENLGTGQNEVTINLDAVTNNAGVYGINLAPGAYELNQTVLDLGNTASFNDLYDFLGFYVGTSGTSATSFDFQNVEIEYVPEPVSMALVGLGILTGGMFIRRRKG